MRTTTCETLIKILLKPLCRTTTEELKWCLKHEKSPHYIDLFKTELKRRKDARKSKEAAQECCIA